MAWAESTRHAGDEIRFLYGSPLTAGPPPWGSVTSPPGDTCDGFRMAL